jgi:demethylmenaquinone methyltransferase / 2-methoxy-6-polyprenyl-1,4-benzoquinol methylase
VEAGEPNELLIRQPNHLAQQLFDGLPARYDRLAEVLSFGQNGRWRQAMVSAVAAASPSSVLDVATGPAGVALQLAARTGARVTGVDITAEMLRAGVANVARSPQAGRVNLLLAGAEHLPFPDDTFDALTFTYLLRYVSSPADTLKELVRVLRPGGVMANLEFHVPTGKLWHPLWLLYTRVGLPAAGFLVGGREWFEVGRFLGPSISAHYRRYPVRWHVGAWEQAGVEDVQVRIMSVGGGLVMWGRKSPFAAGPAKRRLESGRAGQEGAKGQLAAGEVRAGEAEEAKGAAEKVAAGKVAAGKAAAGLG